MNCVFCNSLAITDFHPECFRKAIDGLLKITNILNDRPISASFTYEPTNSYLVICDPTDTTVTRPRKIFNTLDQAKAVAKKLTMENKSNYWVLNLVGRTALKEVV